MSLIENQTYKKKITFCNNTDSDKVVTLFLNIATNHDINKSMLTSIESHINGLFLNDYKVEVKPPKGKASKEAKELNAYRKRIGAN